MKMNVTYLFHCGYAVETNDYTLVFDWVKGDLPQDDKKRIAFITHSHEDHFKKEIFEQKFDYFVVSSDVKIPEMDNIIVVEQGLKIVVEDLEITCLGSTDLGVSFLVESNDFSLFFGGDLNNWHWSQESSPKEVRDMDNWFKSLIQPLKNKKVDVLFFDIDPRLEVDYDKGLKQVLKLISPQYIFPMHFSWAVDKIKKYYETSQIEGLIHVSEPSEVFELEWKDYVKK